VRGGDDANKWQEGQSTTGEGEDGGIRSIAATVRRRGQKRKDGLWLDPNPSWIGEEKQMPYIKAY
jgi:hypothetical protein